MTRPLDNKTFAEATTIKAKSSHTYEADFADSWCIGSVPHGGYVTACFLQVASTHFSTTLSSQNQPHSIALHLDFLRRTQTGTALFTVKDTKLGRQTSVIHITLTQSGREEVLAVITNSNMDTEDGVSYPTSYELNPKPLTVSLELLSQNKDKNYGLQREMPFSKFRKATDKTKFYFPRSGQKSRSCSDEWIRLATGEKWMNATLGYVSDVFPMPVEANAHEENVYDLAEAKKATKKNNDTPIATMWYPTLLLNIEFKKSLPQEGVEWLFVRTETKKIKNGRMDIEVVIFDAKGDIVALSHHIALAVSGERNVAKRVTGTKI